MGLDIFLDLTNGQELGTTPTINGKIYKWNISCNANETISNAYLNVSMPQDLVNIGSYNYQLNVTINRP